MNVENPIALHFILQDELYLLNNDKSLYSSIHRPVIDELIETIVEITPVDETVEVVAVETPLTFNPLGAGKTNFLILVHYPEHEFIAEAHLTALENILKRKGLAMDDVAIVNMARHSEARFEFINRHFKPEKILVLGGNALPAGIGAIELNIPLQMAGSTALYSFSFDEMMDSNELKKAFWEQMKNL